MVLDAPPHSFLNNWFVVLVPPRQDSPRRCCAPEPRLPALSGTLRKAQWQTLGSWHAVGSEGRVARQQEEESERSSQYHWEDAAPAVRHQHETPLTLRKTGGRSISRISLQCPELFTNAIRCCVFKEHGVSWRWGLIETHLQVDAGTGSEGVVGCSLTSELAVLVFGQQEPPGLSDQGWKVWSGWNIAFNLSMNRQQHLQRHRQVLSQSSPWTKDYKLTQASVVCTWYSVRTLGWLLAVSVSNRKDRSRGCGYDASCARMPVNNRLTAMEFSRRFSSRDNRTLMNGPGMCVSQVVFISQQ